MSNYWADVWDAFTNQSNGEAIAEQDQTGTAVQSPPEFDLQANNGGSKFATLGGGPRSLSKCLYVEGMTTEEIEIELKAIDKWLSENSASEKAKILEQSKEALLKEKEWRESYDDVTDSPHNQRNLMGDQGEMTRLMLKNVGYDDPKQYYKEMVSINLFGQKAKGIRPEFAKQLKVAEKKTLEKLGDEDPKLKDPRRAADYMGINEQYRTSRIFKPEKPWYQSMHLYGLAIDINFVNNPWVTMDGSTPKKTKANKKKFRDLVKKIDGLFSKDTNADYKYVGANTEIKDDEELNEIYDGYSGVDKQIEQYFALLEDDAELKKLLDETKHELWKGKDGKPMELKKAKKIIEGDLAALVSSSGRKRGFNLRYRGEKTEVHGKDTMKQEGIMDMDKRMVTSMHEAGLDWGGKYGDMMHFDTRFSPLGKKFGKAKRNPKVKALKNKMKEEK